MTTPEPTPPLTDDELEKIRELWRDICDEQHGPGDYRDVSIDLMDKKLAKVFAEVDRLRAELEAVKDARAAEADEYTRQLRSLPGWCRACPPGCASCLGPDCECYEHDELTAEGQTQMIWDLQTKLSSAQDESARLRAELQAETEDCQTLQEAYMRAGEDAGNFLLTIEAAMEALLEVDASYAHRHRRALSALQDGTARKSTATPPTGGTDE